MMGLCGLGVKPFDRMVPGVPGTGLATSGRGAARTNVRGRLQPLSNPFLVRLLRLEGSVATAEVGQIGLVSTSRMKAAALSQQRRPSSTVGVAPSGPATITNRITPRSAAAPAFASRSRISETRLLMASDGPPTLKGSDQGDLVGVFQVATDGQTASDATDDTDHRLEPLGEIHRGRLTLERRVRRHDDLDEGRPLPRSLVGALQ